MKILQFAPRPPYPPTDGGTLAVHNATQSLLEQGNSLKLLALHSYKAPCDISDLPKNYLEETRLETLFVNLKIRWFDALKCFLKGYSYHVKRFESKTVAERLSQILQQETFDIIHLEGLYLTPYVPVMRKYSDAKIIMRSHNVEHVIWERLAKREKNPIRKFYLKHLARVLKRYELQHINDYDGIASITQTDADYFVRNGCYLPIKTVPFCIDFPDWVDIPTEPNSLCHIGSMSWFPNIEGVTWFVNEVWDKLHEALPAVKAYFAGRRMPDKLLNIEKPNLKIIGEIDDAIRFICSKEIMVVPLLSGSGMRVKIIEGMSLGKTVIATSVAAEGIEYTDGKDILIADTPEEFIEQIRHCVTDKAFCCEIGKNAARLITAKYTITTMAEKLMQLYEEVIQDQREYEQTGNENLVSIVTPCYNSEKYIEETIKSVQSQTYQNWEMLFVDDCSTDNSAAIIKKHASKDPRIRYYKTDKPSGTPTLPRNIAIKHAKGRYIAFLDSDDLWYPNKLALQIPLFENEQSVIVFGDYEKVSENGKSSNRLILSAREHTYASLLYKDEIGCCTAVWDTKKTGKAYFKFMGNEDYEFWLRLMKTGLIATNCGKIVAAYRIRKGSLSANKLKSALWIWILYRKHEYMCWCKAMYYLVINLFRCTVRYIK